MAAFTMPSLGADMDAGTLLEWLVQPGDTVHRGDPVAVVDTNKSAVEVECFDDGVVDELLVAPGTQVPVGTPLAMIRDASPPHRASPATPLVRRRARELGLDLETIPGTGPGGRVTRADVERRAGSPTTTTAPTEAPAGTSPAVPPEAPPAGPPEAPPAGPPEAPPAGTARTTTAGERGAPRSSARGPGTRRSHRVTPYARRLAQELGVDLAEVAGADGTVRADDVRRAAERPGPSAPPAREPATPQAPVDDMRATIARAMARSKREIPHYYLSTTVDLGPALSWMRAQNASRPVDARLVPAALLLKATAAALRDNPALNGYWRDDTFVPGAGIHPGVAVSLRTGGLVAPAIHDAADLSLDALMAALKDLVTRARSGRLRSSELADPTATVTNLGEQGVESVFGVIHPPQVAIVGFGRVTDRPVAVDGLLGVRPTTVLTLAADHRATDGFTGSRFLNAIDRSLQQPEQL